MKKVLRLSDFIFDAGRPIAFYPKFKIITGSSTVAAILLCQMLYWTQITLGDWVYKTADDWEDETGLTEQEQRTARKHLTENGILIERWDNINKQMFYKIDLDKMNDLWDEAVGGTSDFTRLIKDKTPVEEQEELIDDITEKRKLTSKTVVKKGDGVDMELLSMPSAKNSVKIGIVLSYIEQELNVVADSERWKNFAKFALQRKQLYGEDIRVFTKWANEHGFDPVFWSPEKCKTVWTRAFLSKKEDFTVPPLPEVVNNPDALDAPPEDFFKKILDNK